MKHFFLLIQSLVTDFCICMNSIYALNHHLQYNLVMKLQDMVYCDPANTGIRENVCFLMSVTVTIRICKTCLFLKVCDYRVQHFSQLGDRFDSFWSDQ